MPDPGPNQCSSYFDPNPWVVQKNCLLKEITKIWIYSTKTCFGFKIVFIVCLSFLRFLIFQFCIPKFFYKLQLLLLLLGFCNRKFINSFLVENFFVNS